jgi:hypothetical protein
MIVDTESATVLILSPVLLFSLTLAAVSITVGITLVALSIPSFTFGFASRALSALSLRLFPRSLATFGIISVIVSGFVYA